MLGSKMITFGPRSGPEAALAAPPNATATIPSARATAANLAMRTPSPRNDSARTSYDNGRRAAQLHVASPVLGFALLGSSRTSAPTTGGCHEHSRDRH